MTRPVDIAPVIDCPACGGGGLVQTCGPVEGVCLRCNGSGYLDPTMDDTMPAWADGPPDCEVVVTRPVDIARDEWPVGYWLPQGRGVVGLLAHGAVVVHAQRLPGCWQVTVTACGYSAPPVTWRGSLRGALRVTRRTIVEDLSVLLQRLAEREPVPWRTVAALAAAAEELVVT